MPQPKPNLFWPLRLIAILSLVGPGLVFTYATWENRRAMDAQANERIERALDVLQEHALKALQTVDRSISEITEVLRGLPDERIRAQESDFFLRFKRTQQALSQIESIWAFDKHGHPLVSSIVLPVPRELNVSDRSYFKSQTALRAGTYLGEVISARIGNVQVFVVSGRRPVEDAGGFNGIVGITVKPQHFSDFYRKLASGRDAFALVKTDGSILARLPETRLDALGKAERLIHEIQTSPDAGSFTAVSLIDGVERRSGYRRVPGFPVYVWAGIETAALNAQFWRTTLAHFGLGLPAVLAMFSLALYALRRAQRFEEEAARREVAEAALKQAQRLEAIGQLTGGVAHDFNNLLMVIEGNVRRLKKRVIVSDAAPLRAFEAIETAVKRGTSLTRQLLSFSRRQTHEAQIVNLKERLPVIREMLESSLRTNISVDASIAEDLWPTKVDLSEFELALLNLAVNSRDAMPGGGRLTILARNVTLARSHDLALDGDFVSIRVVDTGAGIPPEVLSRVFEPFFTTKDVGKGTGLGLSQVYGFARQAGGTATVSSTPGRGTVVTLFLPRSNQVEIPQPEKRSDRPKERRRGHALLVEDNSEVAEVIREYLEESGYTVHAEPDVASAQAALKANDRKVDLVFTDVMMPGGLNGLDLARAIRREYGQIIPVVLATGYSDYAQVAADEGFVIVRKPIDPSDLRDAIAKAIRKARSH